MEAKIDAAIVNASVNLGVISLSSPLILLPRLLLADPEPSICICVPEWTIDGGDVIVNNEDIVRTTIPIKDSILIVLENRINGL